MLILKAKIRKDFGKKVKTLRKKGILPAVLYGPKIKNLSLEINSKKFEEVYKEAGKSSLVSLQVDNNKSRTTFQESSREKAKTQKVVQDKFLVLIHEIKKDTLTGKPIHIDFYQPILTEEVEVRVPLIFEGEAPAVKELGGTLVKEIQEVTVKALPQNLPHEIKVNIASLKTFEDEILIRDLQLPEAVKIEREPGEIVALVTPLEKIEEELKKPIEEKIEEVEKVAKEEKAKEEEEMKMEKEEKKEEQKIGSKPSS